MSMNNEEAINILKNEYECVKRADSCNRNCKNCSLVMDSDGRIIRMKKELKQQVKEAYELFDDNDISTERLLAMVSDYCNCEVEDVVDVLVEGF